VRARGPTLLVIEDAPDQAHLVGVTARRVHPGLEVRITNDGREGIAYLEGAFQDRRSHPVPDLIILDLVMPGADGFDVLAWMGERPEPPEVPVVVLTGSMKPGDERRCLDLGAVAVHTKPTDLDGLAEVVKRIVKRWIGTGTIIGAHIKEAG